jgi:hypothetical protein
MSLQNEQGSNKVVNQFLKEATSSLQDARESILYMLAWYSTNLVYRTGNNPLQVVHMKETCWTSTLKVRKSKLAGSIVWNVGFDNPESYRRVLPYHEPSQN